MSESIEAIARELAACYGVDWDEADEYERMRWTDSIANLMAGAWDEGREAGDFEVSIGFDRNPYRSQTSDQ